MDNSYKRAVIAGAGPAGLTAAREFLRKTGIKPVIFEADDCVGGISRTVNYKGNRIDIGGHRFFSKNTLVMDIWSSMMPLQSAPSLDEILLGEKRSTDNVPGNPENMQQVWLNRRRVSRIFYLRHFFDYPISLSWSTFANMGLWRTVNAGAGYIWSCMFKKEEKSLENFYINRFGKPLYKMFFEDYTTKVWGVHPSLLGADWGSQRVKGLSLLAVLKDVISKSLCSKNSRQKKDVETSLIEQFIYPKLGPGQLWERMADEIVSLSGELYKKQRVTRVIVQDKKVIAVETEDDKGDIKRTDCDYFLSSMPLNELLPSLQGIDIPEDVMRIATELPYRDFITVGLLVKDLKIKNKTKLKTYRNQIPDTWIYLQERDVKIGRLQIFNNWSPYMVGDYENTMWIGLEYFCAEGDEMWNMDDEAFIEMAKDELYKIGLLAKEDVIDAVRIKMPKAYPSYFGSYYSLDKVKDFLDSIENLYCIGRNGQHRYNNMDHSMLTAIEAVKNIEEGGYASKSHIWNVNSETEYHEVKK